MVVCIAYLQVVSNIPFNISTDVVKILLPMGDIFSEVVLLLQVGNVASLMLTSNFHNTCFTHVIATNLFLC